MSRTAIHPGEILSDELEELGMTAAELGRVIQVPPNRISMIVAGKRAISVDTALRLGRYFGTSAEMWLNLQRTYDLRTERAKLGNSLENIPERPKPDVEAFAY